MAVPTFTLLTEAQFDPGKPMTQEIGLALWRNPLALLGIDDTDGTPAPAIPPGYFVKGSIVSMNENVQGVNGSYSSSSSVITVANSTRVCHHNFISSNGSWYEATSKPDSRMWHVKTSDTFDANDFQLFELMHIGGEWGSTDYVRIVARRVYGTGWPSTIDTALTVGGGWANIATRTGGDDEWQGQATASGSDLQLAFRSKRYSNPTGAFRIDFNFAFLTKYISTQF